MLARDEIELPSEPALPQVTSKSKKIAMMPLEMMSLVLTGPHPANRRAPLPLSFRFPLLSPPRSLESNRRKVAVVGTISLDCATVDASQPAGEDEVRALAAALKKDAKRKGPPRAHARRRLAVVRAAPVVRAVPVRAALRPLLMMAYRIRT